LASLTLPWVGLVPVTEDAATLYETWVGWGGEGIVLKEPTSIYRPGIRSPAWLKVKPKLTLSVVVTGGSSTLIPWGDWGQALLLELNYEHPREGGSITIRQAVRVRREEQTFRVHTGSRAELICWGRDAEWDVEASIVCTMGLMSGTITRMILIASVLLWFGCARPDSIQQTLVTVDVTGTWVGSSNWPSGSSTSSFEVRFELEQQGPTVSGLFRALGPGGLAAVWPDAPSGPIEGTVAGDVFQFSQANGIIVGEMTVSGDEMTGYLKASATFPTSLRRVKLSPRPSRP
jgi:hypothetical protein